MGYSETDRIYEGIIRVARVATVASTLLGLSVQPAYPAESAPPHGDSIYETTNPEFFYAQQELAVSGYVEMIVEFPEIETEPDKGLSAFIDQCGANDEEEKGAEVEGFLNTRPVALVRVTSTDTLQNLFVYGISATQNKRIPVPVLEEDGDGNPLASDAEAVDPAVATGADWVQREFDATGAGARIFIPDTGASKGNLSDIQACFSTNEVDEHGNPVSSSTCPGGDEMKVGRGAGRACSAPGCGHGERVVSVDTRMAPGAEVFPVQIASIDANGNAFISYFSLLRALDYIAGREDLSGSDIVQLSLAYSGYSRFCNDYEPNIAALIKELIARGVLVIDATGNDNDASHRLDGIVPATACIVGDANDPTADGKLSVGSLDPSGTRVTDFTQLGPSVTMGGFDPLNVGGERLSGNSFAVPQAGGVAALMIELNHRTGSDQGVRGPKGKEKELYDSGRFPVQRGKLSLRGLDAAEAARRLEKEKGLARSRPYKIYVPKLQR